MDTIRIGNNARIGALAALTFLLLSACIQLPLAPSAPGAQAPAPGVGQPPARGAMPDCGAAGQPICEFKPAAHVGSGKCADGGFPDPRNGGECWKCPDGTHRTVFPVTANNACERRAEREYSRVSSKVQASGLIRTDCPRGHFLHQLSGWCYACPGGYGRTVLPVDGAQACERTIGPSWHAASFQKRLGCQAPAFFDPRNGGECWQCPVNWNRSVLPVNGRQACTAPAGHACAPGLVQDGGRCLARRACGAQGERPCLMTERVPSCDRGMVEDFAVNRCVRDEGDKLRALAESTLNELRPLLEIAREALICQQSTARYQGYEAALKARNVEQAIIAIGQGGCLGKLRQAAAARGYDTVTVGVAVDASFGFGGNVEVGLALDNRDRYPARIYATHGYSIGWSAGAGGAWTVGFSKEPVHAMAGNSHGFAFSAKLGGGTGAGITFDYHNRFQSVAASAAIGAGANAGVYVRSKTDLLTK